MSDFEINLWKKDQKINTEDIKAGISKNDIKDEKQLSIFNAYDNGNGMLEQQEVNKLKSDIIAVAAEDGDSATLSKREAKKLLSNLGLKDVGINDLLGFFDVTRTASLGIKSCTTEDNTITKVYEQDGQEIKDVYDKNGKFLRREIPAKYQGNDGTLVKNADGSIIFKEVRQNKLFGNVPIEDYFENEEDFNNEKPIKIVTNSETPFQITEEFTYSKNGKLESSKVKDANNNLITEKSYDKQGNVEQEKGYSDGKIKTIKDYINGVISQETEFYDNKETFGQDFNKSITKYNNGKKDSTDYIRPNGGIYRHVEYYSDGSIKYDVEYYPNGNKKCEITRNKDDIQVVTYDENGKITNIESTLPDGYISDFYQSCNTGDCYLLASIIAIRNTANGQEIISNLITKNSDGSYTVELSGAKKAAEGLKKDTRIKNIYITGTYTFSASQVEQIAKRSDLAKGEIDVRLIEAAFEKYREEVLRTKNANGIGALDGGGEAGLATGINPFKILDGGTSEDAMYILTGEQSEVYYNYDAPDVTKDDLQKYDDIQMLSYRVTKGPEKNSKAELNTMLDKIMNDINDGHIDYAVTCGFSMGGFDGHALAIKSVTKDSVILINPWDSSRTITMSRKDFVKKVFSVSIAKIPYTHTPKQVEKPDFPTQEPPAKNQPSKFNPSKPKPGNGGLTPANPDDNELTPVKPKPSNGGLTPAMPDENELTPVKKPDNTDNELTPVRDKGSLSDEEKVILDKADGNSLNRSADSKIKYCPSNGLTYSISGNEFETFSQKDFRKLINDYLNGTEEEKRVIEKIVHNSSNWEVAKTLPRTILEGLKLIYNNYEKYKK